MRKLIEGLLSDRVSKIGTILICILFATAFLIGNSNTDSIIDEDNPLEIIYKPHKQNENQTSYFFLLEPDDLGNMKIEVDIINYNHSQDELFTIIQEGDYSNDVGERQFFKPKLIYLYHDNKIYSPSSNTDKWYRPTGKIEFEYSEGKIQDKKVLNNGITILGSEIEENVTDFSLLIYTKDENSESNLELYPFDTINTVLVFDFPNKSNINFILKIPDQLKSYSVNPSIIELNNKQGK